MKFLQLVHEQPDTLKEKLGAVWSERKGWSSFYDLSERNILEKFNALDGKIKESFARAACDKFLLDQQEFTSIFGGSIDKILRHGFYLFYPKSGRYHIADEFIEAIFEPDSAVRVIHSKTRVELDLLVKEHDSGQMTRDQTISFILRGRDGTFKHLFGPQIPSYERLFSDLKVLLPYIYYGPGSPRKVFDNELAEQLGIPVQRYSQPSSEKIKNSIIKNYQSYFRNAVLNFAYYKDSYQTFLSVHSTLRERFRIEYLRFQEQELSSLLKDSREPRIDPQKILRFYDPQEFHRQILFGISQIAKGEIGVTQDRKLRLGDLKRVLKPFVVSEALPHAQKRLDRLLMRFFASPLVDWRSGKISISHEFCEKTSDEIYHYALSHGSSVSADAAFICSVLPSGKWLDGETLIKIAEFYGLWTEYDGLNEELFQDILVMGSTFGECDLAYGEKGVFVALRKNPALEAAREDRPAFPHSSGGDTKLMLLPNFELVLPPDLAPEKYLKIASIFSMRSLNIAVLDEDMMKRMKSRAIGAEDLIAKLDSLLDTPLSPNILQYIRDRLKNLLQAHAASGVSFYVNDAAAAEIIKATYKSRIRHSADDRYFVFDDVRLKDVIAKLNKEGIRVLYTEEDALNDDPYFESRMQKKDGGISFLETELVFLAEKSQEKAA